MITLNIFLVILSVSLAFATISYDEISRGRKPKLLPNNFDTFRLPNDTRALAYDVSLRTWIDEGNFTFTGTVRIEIIAEEATNIITLHHRELIIEGITLLSSAGDVIEVGTFAYDEVFEFLTIPVTSGLIAGNEYTIVISFTGTMPTTWTGFYAIRYTNSEGNDVYYASTQFEATDARRAFPCYDEIGRKSQFTIRITHSPTYSAISNMPAISDNPTPNPDGSVTTEFEQTPLMPTYLVAFHVSDFAHAFSSASSVPQRVFTRPDVVNKTERALRDSGRMLDALGEHFQLAFVLPKMDSASLPYFGGAMENFGLITYSDYYMLADDSVDEWDKRRVSVEIIAHEQTHQWFGNLVTPTWWTYAWLKEGFATLFHMFGQDLIYPDWNMRDYMLVTTVHNMFRFESDYLNDRPMTHYVEQPEEIDSVFDNVSYSKAATVLRMFLFAFGENTFMEGLRLYLQTHQFSDVTEEDLFDALTTAVSNSDAFIPPTTNVTEIMTSWTRQAGYPLVIVERNYEQDTHLVTLSQARYFNPSPPVDPVYETYWIPYNFATPDSPYDNSSIATGWIPQGQTSVTISLSSLDADDYFLLDTNAGGYYRILYDERNYRLISDAMVRNPEQFTATSKASLLENIREFFNIQELLVNTVMDALRILENEASYIPWYPVQGLILDIDQIFSGHEAYPIFREFIRSLVEELYDSVRVEDVDDEPILNKPARQLAVNLACNMGSVHCRSDALRQLRRIIESGGEFHQNDRRQMYCAALRSAGASDFNFVWNRLLDSANNNRRAELIQALGCSQSRILVNRLLRSLLQSTNENNIEYRAGEAYQLFRSVYQNGVFGLEITLDFVIDNAVEAFETFGGDFLNNMADSVRRNDLIDRFRELLQLYLDAGLISQPVIYVLEEIIFFNRNVLERHGDAISQWLSENFS